MTTHVVDHLAALLDVDRSRYIWRDRQPTMRWRQYVYSCRNDWSTHARV